MCAHRNSKASGPGSLPLLVPSPALARGGGCQAHQAYQLGKPTPLLPHVAKLPFGSLAQLRCPLAGCQAAGVSWHPSLWPWGAVCTLLSVLGVPIGTACVTAGSLSLGKAAVTGTRGRSWLRSRACGLWKAAGLGSVTGMWEGSKPATGIRGERPRAVCKMNKNSQCAEGTSWVPGPVLSTAPPAAPQGKH